MKLAIASDRAALDLQPAQPKALQAGYLSMKDLWTHRGQRPVAKRGDAQQ